MSARGDGEAAFPWHLPAEFASRGEVGMSLRDWFAGLAMQGQIAHGDHNNGSDFEMIADGAYTMADAMLDRRGKQA